MPQLFASMKGRKCTQEVKNADQFSSSQYEAISKSLDEFCNRITNEQHMYVYQQILFTD